MIGEIGSPRSAPVFAPRVNAWTTVVAFASCFLVTAIHSEGKAHLIPCLSAFSNFLPFRLFLHFSLSHAFSLLCSAYQDALPRGKNLCFSHGLVSTRRMIICGAPCPAFSLRVHPSSFLGLPWQVKALQVPFSKRPRAFLRFPLAIESPWLPRSGGSPLDAGRDDIQTRSIDRRALIFWGQRKAPSGTGRLPFPLFHCMPRIQSLTVGAHLNACHQRLPRLTSER